MLVLEEAHWLSEGVVIRIGQNVGIVEEMKSVGTWSKLKLNIAQDNCTERKRRITIQVEVDIDNEYIFAC